MLELENATISNAEGSPHSSEPIHSHQKIAVLVLGMHRSGTSAMARVASLCGAELPTNLMPPNVDNPKGFWESVRLAEFDEDMLKRQGLSWDDPRATRPIGADNDDAELRLCLKQHLEEEYRVGRHIIIKEPRVSRFVPFYVDTLRELGYRVVAILMCRHPLAVARSLKVRNGFESGYSQVLWLRYTLESEIHSRNLNRIFVDYDQLVSSPVSSIREISGALDLEWPTDDSEVLARVESSLDKKDRHHVIEDDASDRVQLLETAAAAYDVIQAFRRSSKSQDAMANMEAIAARLNVDSYEVLIPELQRRTAELRKSFQGDLNADGRETSGQGRNESSSGDIPKTSAMKNTTEPSLYGQGIEDVGDDVSVKDLIYDQIALSRATAEWLEEQNLKSRLLYGAVENEAASARRDLETVVNELDAVKSNLKSVEDELDAVKGSRKTAEHELDAVKGHREALERQLDAVKEHREALERELDVAKGNREATERELDVMKGNREASEHELRVVRGSYEALEQKFDAVKIYREVLERQLDAAKSHRDVLEHELDSTHLSHDKARQAHSEALKALEYQAQQRQELELQLRHLVQSKSWRATRPFRDLLGLLKASLGGRQDGLREDLQARAIRLLQRSGFSRSTHRRLTSVFYGIFGVFFCDTAHYKLWLARKDADFGDHFPLTIDAAAVEKAEHALRSSASVEKLIEQAQTIHLRSSSAPLVSVIIPIYAQVEMTLACLESIARNAPDVPCEYIIVDDASGDPSVKALERVSGIRFSVNDCNLGFLRSCNAAAKAASGDYILFLNNDTLVTPGWVDRLLDIFNSFPDAGLVGSKLLYPDGRLQEAGGIVWNDGSAWNFGHSGDPTAPEYNYVREVDYISGAALMVRFSHFEELGGFDELYAPAYCEDADLAFRLRQRGLRTYYQPNSAVVHFEGVSHGTDLTSGGKAHQVVNQRRLFERWKDVLEIENYPNGVEVFRARERARGRRIMLVVDHYVPRPDRDAGSRLMFQYLMALIASGWVVKFWPDNLHYDPVYTPKLQQIGIETFYGVDQGGFERWIELHGSDIDCALLSRPHIAPPYIQSIRKHSSSRILYCGHDLHSARMKMQNAVHPGSCSDEAVNEIERAEHSIWTSVDASIYPSEEEASAVRLLCLNAKVRSVQPFSYASFDVDAPETLNRRKDVLYVGGFGHAPNVDAAVWLVKAIMPKVWERFPETHVFLVGSSPTDQVELLSSTNVTVTGWVNDEALETHYRNARVAVVPLRFGAGVKSKVTESLRYGLPLVTTSVGAQGLLGVDEVAFVREDASSIADAIIDLLSDDDLWRRQSEDAVDYAKARFTQETLRFELNAAIAMAFEDEASLQFG